MRGKINAGGMSADQIAAKDDWAADALAFD